MAARREGLPALKLADAATVGLIAGQMVASILWDHLGLLSQAKDPIDALKIAGAALIVGGVVLVRGL